MKMRHDLVLTAMPPDVRKVSDLPEGARFENEGFAPRSGHSPSTSWTTCRWGKATTAHQAAEPLT